MAVQLNTLCSTTATAILTHRFNSHYAQYTTEVLSDSSFSTSFPSSLAPLKHYSDGHRPCLLSFPSSMSNISPSDHLSNTELAFLITELLQSPGIDKNIFFSFTIIKGYSPSHLLRSLMLLTLQLFSPSPLIPTSSDPPEPSHCCPISLLSLFNTSLVSNYFYLPSSDLSSLIDFSLDLSLLLLKDPTLTHPLRMSVLNHILYHASSSPSSLEPIRMMWKRLLLALVVDDIWFPIF
ncbi:hypothetical protein GEMRC1_009069 [Eukaryota sp. GEM-RC1]